MAFDLVKGDDHKPSSTEGATIYLSAMVGFICFFLDSEGNRIGIQQPAANKR
ncbi:MAG TPA: hypothetical protein VFD74_09825 [Thermoleophilia bacterium]|nr:hypothetical protein [Thermoleophilia bacterium]